MEPQWQWPSTWCALSSENLDLAPVLLYAVSWLHDLTETASSPSMGLSLSLQQPVSYQLGRGTMQRGPAKARRT